MTLPSALHAGLAAIFGVPHKAVGFEVQDDGLFLLVTIELNLGEPPVSQLMAAAGHLLDQSVPPRSDEYSWMMTFTHAGALMDSESGGWARPGHMSLSDKAGDTM